MTQQYSRLCTLTVGDPSGEALDLSELRVKFSISAANIQTPKTANIRVYNVAPETAARIRKEFTQVLLQAGYVGNAGTIFAGQIRQVRIGRENATDTFIDILAADGDLAYMRAFVDKTLSAGWTPNDIRAACLDAMRAFGVTAGEMADLPDIRGPRGTTLYKPAREILRDLAEMFGMQWSVTLGKLEMTTSAGTTGGEAVELTSSSGLIGLPQQTLDGIIATCLINPQIRPGRRVKLNNASIQEAPISTSVRFKDMRPKLDADGEYKVWAVSTVGDTRGNEWHMELVCVALSGGLPMSQGFRQLLGIYGS